MRISLSNHLKYTKTDHYPIAVFLNFDKSAITKDCNSEIHYYERFIDYNELRHDLRLHIRKSAYTANQLEKNGRTFCKYTRNAC